MFYRLLQLEWKSFFRSASFGKGLAVKLMLGFLGLYFFVVFVALGIGLYYLLEKEFAAEEPIILLNKFLLIWFLGEFIIRFLFQNIPMMDIKPFFAQSVKRKKIVDVVMIKSCFSACNFMTLTVAVPFVIVNLKESSISIFSLLAWLISVFAFVLFLNFINVWIQQRFTKDFKTLLPLIAVLAILIGLEYYNIYSISALFGYYFTAVLSYPLLALVSFLLPFFAFKIASKDLNANLYLDSYLDRKSDNVQATDLSWLDGLGKLAPFIQLDIRLLMRNKRAKNTLYLSVFFLLYGLLIYPSSTYADNSVMLLLVGILMTGIFVINFGQFIPAWDSSYFPLLRTQPIQVYHYLQSKALMMYVSVLLMTLGSLAYGYFGIDKVYVNIASGIYNMGVNIPVILIFSTFNKKRIDLDHSNFMNYQGMGVAQWLIGIPLMLVPMLIWGAMKVVFSINTANIILIVLGVIGLLLTPIILKGVAKLYIERRYTMTEGFKQKD